VDASALTTCLHRPAQPEKDAFEPYAKAACAALRDLGPYLDFAAAFAAGAPPAADDEESEGDVDGEGAEEDTEEVCVQLDAHSTSVMLTAPTKRRRGNGSLAVSQGRA
jgi:hypothetical protein